MDRPRCIPRDYRHDADSRRDRDTAAVNRIPVPRRTHPDRRARASIPSIIDICLHSGRLDCRCGCRVSRRRDGSRRLLRLLVGQASWEKGGRAEVEARYLGVGAATTCASSFRLQHQQYPPHGERVDSATPSSGPLPNSFVCDQEQDASYVNRTSSPLIATPVQFVEVEAEADRYQVQYPIMRSTPELQGIAGPGQDGAELPQGHARSELPLDGERTELPYGCNWAELPTTPKWRP